MADATTPPPTDNQSTPRVGIAIALTLTVGWAYLAWPTLTESVVTPAALRALAAGATALALALAAPRVTRAIRAALVAGPACATVTLASALSAGLAVWFFRGPMNGQVMARDSCLYLLQGRALSHLQFGIPLGLPRLAFSVHFLFQGADGLLHGVFAPGYPLFLAPFAALHATWLAGAVTAVMLTVGQATLARTIDRDPVTLRLSLVLALPSFARAVETADLLSHAFVGSLCALAFSLALSLPARPTLRRAAALGVCAGWVFAARMLDGFILATALCAVLVFPVARRRVGLRLVAVALACGLPFAAFVAAQQRVATGSWTTPTAVAYARRADYPPTCLHLGFGRDVGCVVEHGPERDAFGPDGYTPDDALRIVRERTGVLGDDLFGLGAVALLAFAGLAFAPSPAALAAAVFTVFFTVLYGLFYYGNAPIYGARHVFPLAPFLWVLVARAAAHLPGRARTSGWFTAPHVQGAAVIALLAVTATAHLPRWTAGLAETRGLQGPRQDLRALIARYRLDRAVVLTGDIHSFLAGMDPWADGPTRVFAAEDRAGDLDIRRFHPSLPVWIAVGSGHLLEIHTPTPGPGLRAELERAWPAFVRPHGLGAAPVYTPGCCQLPSSGDHVLLLFAAQPGSSVDIPFDLAVTGSYRLRVDGVVSDDYGTWDLAVDGVPIARWEGYATVRAMARGQAAPPRRLAAGPHTLTATCAGRDPRSRGYYAAFDTLVGEYVP